MDFSYSQEQKMLRESADKFATKGYGFERYKSTLELPGHCDSTLWSQMAELGWLGLPLPEEAGGLGGSALDVSQICEALGSGMVLEPYIAGAVLPGRLLSLCEADTDLLGELAEGKAQFAVAWAEPDSREDPAYCTTRAQAVKVGNEVETLYTNGPAGGGGVNKGVKEILAMDSTLLARSLVTPVVNYLEIK